VGDEPEIKNDGPAEVEMCPLPYGVAVLAKNGKWYVKAAFYTKEYAEAYVLGMQSVGIRAKIVWDDPEKDIRDEKKSP
jgi:hypothetical protein